MAVKELTPVKTPVNVITKFTPEAATTASDGMVFKLPKVTEEYLVVVLQNTSTSCDIKSAYKGQLCRCDIRRQVKSCG